MKYLAIFLLAVVAVGAFEGEFTTVRIGERQPGDQLLGFVANSSVSTTEPEEHELTLLLNAAPDSLISYIHINIFPRWTSFSYPVPIRYNADIRIQNRDTTHLSANAFYYGFPPESPEAIAARADGKSGEIEGRKVITNPDE